MEVVIFLKKYINEAGFSAYLTLGNGVFFVFLAFDRVSYLFFKLKPLTDDVLTDIQRKVLNRDYNNVLQICNMTKNNPQLAMIKSGILSIDGGREAVRSALGAALVKITKDCEKRVNLLGLTASVATLLGLLGTITGLISTFKAIEVADAAAKAAKLSGGISEAMYSTAAGITVGVAAMVVHAVVTTKIEEVTSEVQHTGYTFVSNLEKSEKQEG
jgi:biopolymer transport protein ExbB/TolQ